MSFLRSLKPTPFASGFPRHHSFTFRSFFGDSASLRYSWQQHPPNSSYFPKIVCCRGRHCVGCVLGRGRKNLFVAWFLRDRMQSVPKFRLCDSEKYLYAMFCPGDLWIPRNFPVRLIICNHPAVFRHFAYSLKCWYPPHYGAKINRLSGFGGHFGCRRWPIQGYYQLQQETAAAMGNLRSSTPASLALPYSRGQTLVISWGDLLRGGHYVMTLYHYHSSRISDYIPGYCC